MLVLRVFVLTVRFACELGMLAALVTSGHALVRGGGGWGLGLGAALLAGVVWGLFVAPKARHPVSVPVRLAIELALFGTATAALAASGHATAAAVLGASALSTSWLNAATAPSSARP